jgi:voltage-gated potassium channel
VNAVTLNAIANRLNAKIMNFLQVEPTYIISFEEIFWGGILVAFSMGIHGIGMLWVLRVNHSVNKRSSTKKNLITGLWPIIFASFMIIFVHLTEVLLWSLFFMWRNCFANGSLSFYFALNEYTTVGSKLNLPLNWRLLEGMISITGLLTFAWSTGVLFTLAKEFQESGFVLFARRHHKN